MRSYPFTVLVLGACAAVVVGVASAATVGSPQLAGRLAFSSSRGGSLPHIWVMNADGTSVHVLTRVFSGEYPAWSSDGKRIAFATNEPLRQNGFDIVVANADGSNPHRVTRNELYEMGP